MSQIQERMKKLGIKQVDMILELRKRGIAVQPPKCPVSFVVFTPIPSLRSS